jgi:CubicO group peptidase (beta-lactamase class C family)
LSTEEEVLINSLAAEENKRENVEVPASFTADSVRKLENQLDSIFHHLHQIRGFNGTVLVTKYDQVIFKGAFGFADFAKKKPLNTQTAFQLASVSKQFTAMAIMILKEQGKLDYDDLIQHYLPGFPYPGITIRQLLTHRSGLSNYTYFSDRLWPDRKLPLTNDDVLNLMALHQPQVYYQPDSKFDYSNTGYFLLASIVKKSSGIPFADFLRKNIFEPLEMTHTFCFSNPLFSENVATGHTGKKRKRSPDYLDSVLGDKGTYSTVEDLYKWDQALYTDQLVNRETLEEAFKGSRKNKNKNKEDYGFGWRIKELKNGDTVLYHAGLWHGYNTYILRNPKDHSAIIVLSNLSNGGLRFLNELQDFLYPITASADKNVSGQAGRFQKEG